MEPTEPGRKEAFLVVRRGLMLSTVWICPPGPGDSGLSRRRESTNRGHGKACGVKNVRLWGERAAQLCLSSASCELEWRDAFLSSTEHFVMRRALAFSLAGLAAPGVEWNHNLPEAVTSGRHGSAQDRLQCPVRGKDGGAHAPRSKLILLATRQTNQSREFWGQGIATLFRKPADQEDRVLVSQRTILPGFGC